MRNIKSIVILDLYGGEDSKRIKNTIKKQIKEGPEIHGHWYHFLKIDGANYFTSASKDGLH
ncbi:MAG: hypothetical protein KAU29_11785 [Gammaproteobacteria bacterium]|nr:hypothetical protein [Gammaproteobacteria bacterium]